MTKIMADPLAPLGAIWCTVFDCSQLPTYTLVTYRDQLDFMPSDQAQMVLDTVDTRLDLHWIQLRGNDNTSWVTQHAIHIDAWSQWRVRVRDGPAAAVEALLYPSDEYIRWYKGITRVYIGNPANRDTRAHDGCGYEKSVDDHLAMHGLHRGTLGCTPSQHHIQATFPVQPSRRRPQEHVLDRGARGVKKGAGRPPVPPAPQRQEHVDPGPTVVERGEGSGRGQQYVDPFDSPHLDMASYSLGLMPDPQSLPSGSGMSQMPPAPSLGFAAFQSPYSSAYGFLGVRAPPPPGIAGSSTPHQLISQASSSDEEEGQDALGRGHRVGKKPSRHPTGLSCTYIIFYFSLTVKCNLK
ncbi:hypothetical protein M9H77_12461 [Catharanthus roseus]|uniref:Uncharacterized protein n=1 Tax=Catharanthus roseus TaxID=4058 RepID=A0ACC0BHG8_CATRO|nr:hypothetical protein M9H77_12461 [Catharanthus roseus]